MKHSRHDEIVERIKLIKQGKATYPKRHKKVAQLLVEFIIQKLKKYDKNI